MKGFKLYLYNNNKAVLFSSYLRGNNNNTITFDEVLEEGENDQFTLNFSIMEDIGDNFPSNLKLFDYLKIGRKLKLEYEEREEENYIDLIITSISPEGSSENIKYNIQAIDYARYIFTRNNIGLNFDSMNDFELDKEIFNDVGGYNNSTITLNKPYSLIYKIKADDKILIKDEDFNINIDDISIKVYGNYSTIIVEYYPASTLIYTGNLLLKRGGLQTDYIPTEWTSEIDYNDNNWFITIGGSQDSEDGEENPIENIFNISVSDSNTYNVLVEMGNLIESNFIVNYSTKTITYYWKKDSYYIKNYQLSPELNLQDLSLDYDGEELYSILYVQGSDNEYDMNVGLTPTLSEDFINIDWENQPNLTLSNWERRDYYTELDLNLDDAPEFGSEEKLQILNWIPYLDNFIFNLDYFIVNNLISEFNFEKLFNLIFNDLRKINVKYQGLIRKKYIFEDMINKLTNKIENECELLLETENNDLSETHKKIDDYFKYGVDILYETGLINDTDISYSSANNSWIYNNGTDNLFISDFLNIIYFNNIVLNISGTNYTISNVKTNSSGEASIINGDYRIKLKISINDSAIIKDNLINWTIIKKEKKDTIKSWSRIFSSSTAAPYFGTTLPDVADPNYNLGDEIYWTNRGTYHKLTYSTVYRPTAASVSVSSESFQSLTIKYTNVSSSMEFIYFENIIKYSGWEGLQNKLLDYKKELITLIKERKEIESDITRVESDISSLTPGTDEKISKEAELSKLEDDLEIYKSGCGTWDYSNGNFINNTNETSEMGKYNWIYKKFKDNYDIFLNENGITTIPVDEEDTIVYKYKQIEKQKNKLWFDIKREFGEFLLEGYYTNDVESRPINLLKQGSLYHDRYKEPRDSYGITYLDISDVIGKEINSISVGDFINIKNYNLELVNQLNNQLKVISLSRNLRSSSDIQISVDRIRPIDTLIEKIIKTSNV